VNIGPVTVEFNRVKRKIFAEIWPQFDDRPTFGTLAIRNGLEYHNFYLSMLIGSHFGTLSKIFVRFGSVTLELKT